MTDAFAKEINDAYLEYNLGDFFEHAYNLSEILSEKDINDLLDAFEYQGLDPKIIKELITKSVIKYLLDKGTLSRDMLLSKTAEMKKRVKILILREILTLCIFFISRGNQSAGDKVLGRSKEGIKGFLEKMRELGIKSSQGREKAGQVLKDRNTLTLARVAAAFPVNVSDLLEQNDKLRILGKGQANLPKALCWSGGAALIPTDDEPMFTRYLAWAKSFDEVINAGVTRTDDQKKAYEQFARNAWNSGYIDNATRKEMIKRWTKPSLP